MDFETQKLDKRTAYNLNRARESIIKWEEKFNAAQVERIKKAEALEKAEREESEARSNLETARFAAAMYIRDAKPKTKGGKNHG